MTTRSEAKPTPGPWRARETPESSNQDWMIESNYGGRTNSVASINYQRHEGEAEANAALIVRAVNCHAQLVEALEHAHTYFLQSNKLTADDRDMLDEMWAALRAAKGK